MEKGKIRRLKIELSEELQQAQEFFINDAEEHTDAHIDAYRSLDSSINGKYICSDLFKETFPKYVESIESRKKYSEVIHNSAACLAGDYFDQLVSNPEINKCVFLSGVPGAGKSYLIQSIALSGTLADEKFILDDAMIYEGDITTPTIYEKLDKCVENGKDIFILIVNPTLELAQRNAISRHFEIGRGASCETMSRILSKLPNAVQDITSKYDVELGIYNKSSNYDINYTIGNEYIDTLNHGTYDEILNELQTLRLQILEEIKKKSELGDEIDESREKKFLG